MVLAGHLCSNPSLSDLRSRLCLLLSLSARLDFWDPWWWEKSELEYWYPNSHELGQTPTVDSNFIALENYAPPSFLPSHLQFWGVLGSLRC